MKGRAKMLRVRPLSRFLLLLAVLAAGLAAIMWARSRPALDPPRLSYVTTAHQLGVVGYRDPVGGISADGTRFAYAEGRRLFEVAVGGGAVMEIAAAEGQIRHLAPRGSAGDWIFEDGDASQRWWIASARAPKRPLFRAHAEVEGAVTRDSTHEKLGLNELRQLASSPDGEWLVGTANRPSGAELWRVTADGSRAELMRVGQPIAWPVWTPAGDIACTILADGRWRLSRPCGEPPIALEPAIDVIGPIAFAHRTSQVVFASANDRGTVDLWRAQLDSRQASRLATFARDSYAPSIAADDTVVFKTQSYRTSVVELDLASGRPQQLSTLQSETPSYHPGGQKIAVTYGTWRRVLDDAKYPDIAQEIGVLPAAADGALSTAPTEVIAASNSEDQAMAWSPNGKWIAFHSHREQSDDVWLRPAASGGPDRRISFLGRGAEVGWPRWSPDGRLVLFDGASPTTRRSVPFVVGIDQDTGQITAPPREIPVSGFEGEITHAEWLPDSRTIVAIAKDAPGQHVILTLAVTGGQPAIVHRFASEHDFPGLASAPDGRSVAMVAPASDGFYQIFRLPLDGGGAPQQLTSDRSNKSQPAFSPDGRRLAYTVWSYDAHFFSLALR
jgi:Tol biopolymer transport system component